MPLPFLAAIPAVIAGLSTTTLIAGGAVIALGVIASLGAFFKYIDDKKKELGATEAKITDLYRNGEYATCDVGLGKKNRTLATIECEVEDKDCKLYKGMTI